jgi:hypothetical protein
VGDERVMIMDWPPGIARPFTHKATNERSFADPVDFSGLVRRDGEAALANSASEVPQRAKYPPSTGR